MGCSTESNAIVGQGVKTDTKGANGLTPLIYSMSGKTLSGFERLLERGAGPNAAMNEGESAVSLAVARKHPDALKIVLARGGNPNLRVYIDPGSADRFVTPLDIAISEYNAENVVALIKAGADINAKDFDGLTPLVFATSCGAFNAASALLEAGSDFHATLPDNLVPDRTIADLVLLHVVRLTMRTDTKAPDYVAAKKSGLRVRELLHKRGVDFAKSNAADLKMIELRADIFSADARMTASDAAVLGLPYPPYRAADFFADPKVAQLAEAARDGQLDRIDRLIAQGANPNGCGNDGLRPVMYALAGEDTKGLDRLLSNMADPNRQTDDGDSAVSLASRRKGSEALAVVLGHGGNPNLRRPSGARRVLGTGPSPIYDAMRSGSVQCLRVLVRGGAGLNAPPSDAPDRNPPLTEAARLGEYEMVYVLLDAGADFHRVNTDGHTVADEMFCDRQYKQTFTTEQAKYRQRCIDFLEANGVNLAKQSP